MVDYCKLETPRVHEDDRDIRSNIFSLPLPKLKLQVNELVFEDKHCQTLTGWQVPLEHNIASGICRGQEEAVEQIVRPEL